MYTAYFLDLSRTVTQSTTRGMVPARKASVVNLPMAATPNQDCASNHYQLQRQNRSFVTSSVVLRCMNI
ncbi:hypothetical protein Y032_0030g2175 [Ancylostoma ceylanicum]|uniref:Uncharacterized protein n=1 Tax=Ancylostoma ceylanicum TaxID=53326 RepID=A0A016UR22_9BILA|nr:hypothetical protein Y032_0030g2175 [Ancylostoma ceylanicum]